MAGEKSELRTALASLRRGSGFSSARVQQQLTGLLGADAEAKLRSALDRLGNTIQARALRAAYNLDPDINDRFLTHRLNTFAVRVRSETGGVMRTQSQVEYWCDQALDDLETLLLEPTQEEDELYHAAVTVMVRDGLILAVETIRLRAVGLEEYRSRLSLAETNPHFLERQTWVNRTNFWHYPFFIYTPPPLWVPQSIIMAVYFQNKFPSQVVAAYSQSLLDITTYNGVMKEVPLQAVEDDETQKVGRATFRCDLGQYYTMTWAFTDEPASGT